MHPLIRRSLAVLFITSALVLAGAGHFSAHAAIGRTSVGHVHPFTSSGAIASGYRVTAWHSGSCWTTSSASTRHDAFRCSIGNFLLDPCFSNPAGTRVACPSGDRPHRLVGIKLTKALPSPNSGGHADAWLLQVRSGVWCRLDTGATTMVDGFRANFSCSNGSWLYGSAKRSAQPWRIRMGRGQHPHLRWTSVRSAWF